MTENITIALAVEVEVCVVCEVDNCWSVRLCSQCKTELALLCPLVTYDCLYSTRISLLAVLRIIHELDSALMLAALPYLVLESLRTSVKVVRTVVYWKCVLYSVKSELAECYTVCITARNLARAWSVSEIACRLRISENNVCKVAVLVRHHNGYDAGSYRRKLHVCTLLILQCIKEYLLTAWGSTPEFSCYIHMDQFYIS